MSREPISVQDIEAAKQRIAPHIRTTPFEFSRALSERHGLDVYLKLECFQSTGSFKLRGALAKLTALSEGERKAGIVAVSVGNHGLGVAQGAASLGLEATIVVPCNASRVKVAAIKRYPVTVREHGNSYEEAEAFALDLAKTRGATFVSPYDDFDVICGQGTIGLEILDEMSDLDALLVPTSGGGLIAGVAIAVKSKRPGIKIYGVEPATTPAMTRSIEAGHVVQIDEEPTIADGLAGNIDPEAMTFPLVQQFVDAMFLVEEKEIMGAMAEMAELERLMVEGAGAVGIAALPQAAKLGLKRVGVVISGRNVTLEAFERALQQAKASRV